MYVDLLSQLLPRAGCDTGGMRGNGREVVVSVRKPIRAMVKLWIMKLLCDLPLRNTCLLSDGSTGLQGFA